MSVLAILDTSANLTGKTQVTIEKFHESKYLLCCKGNHFTFLVNLRLTLSAPQVTSLLIYLNGNIYGVKSRSDLYTVTEGDKYKENVVSSISVSNIVNDYQDIEISYCVNDVSVDKVTMLGYEYFWWIYNSSPLIDALEDDFSERFFAEKTIPIRSCGIVKRLGMSDKSLYISNSDLKRKNDKMSDNELFNIFSVKYNLKLCGILESIYFKILKKNIVNKYRIYKFKPNNDSFNYSYFLSLSDEYRCNKVTIEKSPGLNDYRLHYFNLFTLILAIVSFVLSLKEFIKFSD